MLTVLLSGPVLSQESQNETESLKPDLEACLKTALENNHRRPASRFAVVIAEAQHRQALAGYWPQVTAQGGFSKLDEAVNFKYPEVTLTLPATMGGMSVSMPEQDINILSEKNYTASVQAVLLLYDGGMRKGYSEQAKSYVDIKKQESRRTDLEIIDSVKRYYWGAVLARKLHQVGLDTLNRMETTLDLTESMYKEGLGSVKKTDWLNNKIMVESLKSMIALLEKNELAAEAALANTMGLAWDKNVQPKDTDIPFTHCEIDMEKMVDGAFRFNPDWAQLEAGISALEGGLKIARSGYHPRLAITGDLHKWWPENDNGLATSQNKEGWNLGIGVEIPIFSGMLTKNKIAAAKASIAKIKAEQLLLKEGIGLQVRNTILSLSAAEKAYHSSQNAMTAAMENRDLNTRAYQNELVKTDDVVRAQLTEALMTAQHYKSIYDHIVLLSQLNLIVGKEVLEKIR